MTTPSRLIPGSALTNALVTYYTAPANTTAIIKSASAVNTSAGTVKLTVHIVPNAGAAAVANEIISARPIGPGATDSLPELVNQVLPPGYFLQAKDDTGAVTGFEASGFTVP